MKTNNLVKMVRVAALLSLAAVGFSSTVGCVVRDRAYVRPAAVRVYGPPVVTERVVVR